MTTVTNQYQLTKKMSVKTGDIIMMTSVKRGYRLYTNIEKYGKEPKISEKHIVMLLAQNRIVRVNVDRNAALGTTSTKYKVV